LIKREVVPLHVGKQQFSVPTSGDHAQKARGNNAIRINMIRIVNRDPSGVGCKAAHIESLAQNQNHQHIFTGKGPPIRIGEPLIDPGVFTL
jgi:hypothetical protein